MPKTTIPASEWAPLVHRLLEGEEHTLKDIAEFCGVGVSSIRPPAEEKEKNLSRALFHSLKHFEEYVVNGSGQSYLLKVPVGQVGQLHKMCEFLGLPKAQPIE